MKTIFFDLDGTLTDPKPGITRSIQFALERLGRPVPVEDELTWCIGPPLLASLRQLLGDDDLAANALVLYRERFSETGLYENTVYEGIPEALESLRAANARLYVATSKPRVYAERILDHFGLSPYFATTFGSELDGTRVDKTELLRHALRITKATPSRSTMIGDREHDMIGARNNGLKAVGVLYGYGAREELEAAGAGALIAKPLDLFDIIQRAAAGA